LTATATATATATMKYSMILVMVKPYENVVGWDRKIQNLRISLPDDGQA
jgi:hypothetical protein